MIVDNDTFAAQGGFTTPNLTPTLPLHIMSHLIIYVEAQNAEEKIGHRRRFDDMWEKNLGSIKNCTVLDDVEYTDILNLLEMCAPPTSADSLATSSLATSTSQLQGSAFSRWFPCPSACPRSKCEGIPCSKWRLSSSRT